MSRHHLRSAVMRRGLVIAVLLLVVLATPVWPALAQTPPPEPKISITGTFDQITSAGGHIYDGNFSRVNVREWYARTRLCDDLVFAVWRDIRCLTMALAYSYGLH